MATFKEYKKYKETLLLKNIKDPLIRIYVYIFYILKKVIQNNVKIYLKNIIVI